MRVEDDRRIEAQAKPGLAQQTRDRVLANQAAVVEHEQEVVLAGWCEPVWRQEAHLVRTVDGMQSRTSSAQRPMLPSDPCPRIGLIELVAQRDLVAGDADRVVETLSLDESMYVTLPHALLRVDEVTLPQVLGAPQEEEEGDEHGQKRDETVVRLEPKPAVGVDGAAHGRGTGGKGGVKPKGGQPLGEVQRLWDAGMASSSHQGWPMA